MFYGNLALLCPIVSTVTILPEEGPRNQIEIFGALRLL